jgi:hypothetical protein
MDTYLRWIMLVAGLLTFTMVYAVVAPQAALKQTFGATLEGPLAEIVVRNWGALIALVGLMLIYGAFRPAVRGFVLVIALLSKVVYIALVLCYGREYLMQSLVVSIAVDAIMVMLFIACLMSLHRARNRG